MGNTEALSLKRALTRWLILNRIGKKPSTQHFHWEIVKAIRRAWRPCLAKPVAEIDDDDITRFALAAGHFSPSRWNAMLTVIHAAAPTSRSLKRRPARHGEKRMPTQAEFARLLQECDRLPRSRAGLVINFLAHTGMRITEARLLTWSDVHADRIEVPASIQKNSRPRTIPAVNGLAGLLDRLRAIADGSGYVLPRPGIRRGLAKACERAGLPDLTHHDFRHLFATRCIESGVDVPTVARWMGHRDQGALLSKRYFHMSNEHSRRMAEKVKI